MCDFDNCDKPVQAKGLCYAHYQQQRRGRPLRPIHIPRGPKPRESKVVLHECAFPSCEVLLPRAPLCEKHVQIRRMYSLTVEQVVALFEPGVCSLCGTTAGTLVVDHDHSCCGAHGRAWPVSCGLCVRGVVCANCNARLGVLENAVWREQAQKYLTSPRPHVMIET